VKDYQERSDFLERLKDQFVIAISPSIINCLTSQDLESAQYFYRMLLRLNRSSDFENYCVKVTKSKTSQLSTLVERLCNSLDIVHSDCLATMYKNYIALVLRKVEEMSDIEAQQKCSETECWTRLSCCLKLTEFCGNFLLNFEKMRHSTMTSINNLNENFSRQLAELVGEPATDLKYR
uniref:Conserved oligomeric Golgi complex subunit 7 n=1 Tax=Romanomermis culicivorax TaxID=13658 RepID=A0A915JAG0_ROMCU